MNTGNEGRRAAGGANGRASGGARERGGPRLALLCVAQFVVVLDVTIVAIALPAIRRDLGFDAAGLEWVISAYTLTFGGGPPPGSGRAPRRRGPGALRARGGRVWSVRRRAPPHEALYFSVICYLL